MYLRARYYDPATEQFISRDPLEAQTGQPYTYAYGNPVNFVDPAGMDGEPVQQSLPGFFRQRSAKWSINYSRLDKHQRPTGVQAVLTKALLDRKQGTPVGRYMNPPGWAKGLTNLARAHLLARQLGGSGTEARNIVALEHNPANNSIMKQYENAVRSAVAAGQTVSYSVIPIYRGAEDRPAGLRIRAEGSGGFNLNKLIVNRWP